MTLSGAAWFPTSCSAVALPGAGPTQPLFSRVAGDAGHQAEDPVWADRTRVPRCRLRAPCCQSKGATQGHREPQKAARVSSLRLRPRGLWGSHARGQLAANVPLFGESAAGARAPQEMARPVLSSWGGRVRPGMATKPQFTLGGWGCGPPWPGPSAPPGSLRLGHGRGSGQQSLLMAIKWKTPAIWHRSGKSRVRHTLAATRRFPIPGHCSCGQRSARTAHGHCGPAALLSAATPRSRVVCCPNNSPLRKFKTYLIIHARMAVADSAPPRAQTQVSREPCCWNGAPTGRGRLWTPATFQDRSVTWAFEPDTRCPGVSTVDSHRCDPGSCSRRKPAGEAPTTKARLCFLGLLSSVRSALSSN